MQLKSFDEQHNQLTERSVKQIFSYLPLENIISQHIRENPNSKQTVKIACWDIRHPFPGNYQLGGYCRCPAFIGSNHGSHISWTLDFHEDVTPCMWHDIRPFVYNAAHVLYLLVSSP